MYILCACIYIHILGRGAEMTLYNAGNMTLVAAMGKKYILQNNIWRWEYNKNELNIRGWVVIQRCVRFLGG